VDALHDLLGEARREREVRELLQLAHQHARRIELGSALRTRTYVLLEWRSAEADLAVEELVDLFR
jgi:hypothetical protein